MSLACARSFGQGMFTECKVVEAKGVAGAILLFLDKIKLDLVEVETGLFSITRMFKNVEDGFQWAFTGVYGPVERWKRELFWEELGSLKGLWEGPCCLGGDFNVILSPLGGWGEGLGSPLL